MKSSPFATEIFRADGSSKDISSTVLLYFRGNYLRIISIPKITLFWYYSLYQAPFKVRSGEVALNCPVYS